MLTSEILTFADGRDWRKYYRPRNLVLALNGELGELSESVRQYPEPPAPVTEQSVDRICQEISDVTIYLLELAHIFNIDLSKADSNSARDLHLSRFEVPSPQKREYEKMAPIRYTRTLMINLSVHFGNVSSLVFDRLMVVNHSGDSPFALKLNGFFEKMLFDLGRIEEIVKSDSPNAIQHDKGTPKDQPRVGATISNGNEFENVVLVLSVEIGALCEVVQWLYENDATMEAKTSTKIALHVRRTKVVIHEIMDTIN